MKTYMIVLLLMSSFHLINGQTIFYKKLKWEVNSLADKSSGQTVSYSCDFSTEASTITWKQIRNTITIQVLDIQTSWVDINTDGSATLRVMINGDTGTMTFERKSGQLNITLDLEETGGNKMNYAFAVKEITSMQP